MSERQEDQRTIERLRSENLERANAATVAELRAEVERLSGLLEEGGRRLIDENMRANAAERRVGELLDVVKYAVDNPEFNSQQFVYMCKSALANRAALTGADPT